MKEHDEEHICPECKKKLEHFEELKECVSFKFNRPLFNDFTFKNKVIELIQTESK